MKWITLIIASILVLTSASAEFDAYGDDHITFNLCEDRAMPVTIYNPELTEQTFSISIDGDFDIQFSEIDFIVEPEQYKQITAFYQAPCEAGEHTLDIYFTSDIEKVLTQTILVAKKDNINLTTSETRKIVPACGKTTYDLMLQNPTNSTETYTIALVGHKDAHISDTLVTLLPKEQHNITVDVELQDCSQTGKYPLKLTISNEASKGIGLELEVQNMGIPEIAVESTKIRADYGQSSTDMPIKNTGTKQTAYEISVQGPNWATIAPTILELKPGETKPAKLILNPTNDTAKGNYDITLSVILQESQIAYDTNFVIKLGPPTFIEKYPNLVVAIGIIILALIAGAIYLIIKYNEPKAKEKRRKKQEQKENKRQKVREQRERQRQQLKEQKEKKRQRRKEQKERQREQKEKQRLREYHEKQKLKEQKLTHREKERLFKQREAQRKPETKKTRRTLEETHYTAKKDTRKKEDSKYLLIFIIGALLLFIGIFFETLITNWQSTLLGLLILAIVLLIVRGTRAFQIVKRLRILDGRKQIKLWKSGLTQAALTAKKELADITVSIKKIKPHTKKGAHYQTFIIDDNSNSKLTYECSFKVSKRWLKRNRVPQDNIRLAKLNKQAWQTVRMSIAGEDRTHIYYTAELRPGTYTIHGKQERLKPHKPVAAIIIALAIIAGIAITALGPQSKISTIGIPAQTWTQNTQHTINLNHYFTDPDNDKLTYSATKTKYIGIDIVDGTAILTPPANWIGGERVRFTAEDGKGGTAHSNIVSLMVTKSIITPGTQPYIAIAFGALAILILILGLKGLHKSKK